jgi:hypothetical protein
VKPGAENTVGVAPCQRANAMSTAMTTRVARQTDRLPARVLSARGAAFTARRKWLVLTWIGEIQRNKPLLVLDAAVRLSCGLRNCFHFP